MKRLIRIGDGIHRATKLAQIEQFRLAPFIGDQDTGEIGGVICLVLQHLVDQLPGRHQINLGPGHLVYRGITEQRPIEGIRILDHPGIE